MSRAMAELEQRGRIRIARLYVCEKTRLLQQLGEAWLDVGHYERTAPSLNQRQTKALFMTVWCPDSRSVESNCGIPRG